MKKLTALGFAALLLGSAAAQQPKKIFIDFKDIKLKNGLRVILAEDHSAPVVSIAIIYNVGSRNERPGRTGFAHLFEHMMFTGSENVGKNEYAMLIETNGGGRNGSTSADGTAYYAMLPANQLDLLLFLEADRMRSLDVTQENLDNQRNTVQEERREGLDNQPYGKAGEKFQETMFDNFAYKHLVMGSMEDLNAASLKEVVDFFQVYYAPSNAALALVGDFKADAALAKVKSYFESIPSKPAPPRVDTTEPTQTAERRVTVEDPLARLPQIVMGYKGIVNNTPDYYAMQVLNQVLAAGQSSRLYQKLIKEKELATSLLGYTNAFRGNGDYEVTATASPGKKLEDIETAINEEITRLQQEPIADWELTKAKNAMRRLSISGLNNSVGIALRLSQFSVFYDDPGLVNTQFDKYAAVTKQDVQRVASKYLKPANRTVAITIPQQKAAGVRSDN